jgi:MFS family permease
MKMVPVLLGWYLYDLTGSKLVLGMLGLSEVIPAILLALPAGVKVDSVPKRSLILKCLLLYAIIAIGFVISTSHYVDILSSQIRSFIIFGLVACTGIVRAYISPSFSAFLSQLVTREELVRAASINSMTWLLAAIIGPSFAGILVGFIDVSSGFLIVMLLILVGLFVFMFVADKPLNYEVGKVKTWESVRQGLDFVYHQKALLGAMSLDMFAVLFGGAIALLPVFAKDILSVGPQAFGLLMSATYLGNFLAISFLTKYPLRGRQGYKLIYSVAGFGLCMIIFALSESFVLSFLVLIVSGLFDGVSVIIRGTIFQLLVPDQMRGRVSSVSSIFINSSNELGQFESGVAATALGTVPSVVFGGCMTLLVSAYAWLKIPALKKLEY